MRKRERRKEGRGKTRSSLFLVRREAKENQDEFRTESVWQRCLEVALRGLSPSLCERGKCYRRGRSRIDLREGVAIRQRAEVGEELRRERAEDREISGICGTQAWEAAIEPNIKVPWPNLWSLFPLFFSFCFSSFFCSHSQYLPLSREIRHIFDMPK